MGKPPKRPMILKSQKWVSPLKILIFSKEPKMGKPPKKRPIF